MARLTSIAAYGFDDLPTSRLLAAFASLGVEALQFYRNEARPPTPREAIRIAADAGLTFDSVHGVFGPQYDPSSPDEARRRASVEIYRLEGRLALELGGSGVVVHPSPQGTRQMSERGPDDPVRIQSLRRSVAELAEMGRELGVTYLLENLPPDYAAARPSVVGEVVAEVNDPHLRMCFDVGHGHMYGNLVADLISCSAVIGYLHIHDNDTTRDAHMIPGDGTLPWDAVTPQMLAMPRDIAAMLELFQSPEEFERRRQAGLADQLRRWLALGRGC